jgi:hypothetical protein
MHCSCELFDLAQFPQLFHFILSVEVFSFLVLGADPDSDVPVIAEFTDFTAYKCRSMLTVSFSCRPPRLIGCSRCFLGRGIWTAGDSMRITGALLMDNSNGILMIPG